MPTTSPDGTNSSHRLAILSQQEVDDLFGLPRFTEEQQELFFDFSTTELNVIATKTFSVGVYLALELGYFKAKRQFFNFDQPMVIGDLQYLIERYFGGRNDPIKLPSRPVRISHQRTILELLNYRICDKEVRSELESKAQRIAMLSTQPVFILRELLHYMTTHRIVAPLYTSLQDFVGRAVNRERSRVLSLLNQNASPMVIDQLDALLNADERMYRITSLKKEPKNFSYKELKQEVVRRQYFQALHDFTKGFLEIAGLSAESIKYYSSLVKYYTVYKLRRMHKGSVRLYLLCFAYQCFREVNDNLIEAFIYLVHHYEKLAKHAAGEQMKKAMEDASKNLKAAGDLLALFVDESISADTPFEQIQQRAFTFLERENIPVVADYLRNIEFDKVKAEWAYYTTLSMTIKRNLRHLFSELEFVGRVEDAPLLSAVIILQDLFRRGKSLSQVNAEIFPTDMISKTQQLYLYEKIDDDNEKLDLDRYEFMVYRLLRNALESGDLCVVNSNQFLRFEDDLINDERWKNKDEILKEIGAPLLQQPIEETLAMFKEALESRFADVNKRVLDYTNEHIKLRGKGEKRKWSLVYPTADTPINSPFYSHLPSIGIADLLAFVGARTGFLNEFTHVLERYVKYDPEPRKILASLVAMGTNMGLAKMAEVSGIGFPSLASVSKSFVRPETLKAANDAISNAIAKLPVFHLYNIREELHSSSDGQRIETKIDTFNARYSPKYFGLDKGVSVCTLIANHVPINGRVIGTHEHES